MGSVATQTIIKQAETYGRESWEVAHDEAMRSYELDLWLRHGLNLRESLLTLERQMRERSVAGEASFTNEQFDAVYAMIEAWYEPCEELLRVIDDFERRGYPPELAKEYRAASRTSPFPGMSYEAMERGMRQIANGQHRPLEDVIRELRD